MRKMKETENKLSMEKYLDFVDSSKQTYLKMNFLRQIVKMHGFKIEAPKSVVVDALKTIDLMNPSRSTLKENISSAVSVTLNDVIKDLKDLTWQECCITSIKIINLRQDQEKEKHDTFSILRRSTGVHQVSKSIGDTSAASTSSKKWVESEIHEKSKKRKRNACGGDNSSTA